MLEIAGSRVGRRALALATLVALGGTGCGRRDTPDAATTSYVAAPEQAGRDLALLTVEDFGEIRIELFADKAPKTVRNFEELARKGFYDGTTFHRVLPGFMIQGGDPNSKNRDPRDDGQGGPPYSIDDERNDVDHRRGIVAMANTGRKNTGGSQFFIVVADSPHLNGGYTVFGRVVGGMDVVDRIVLTPRDEFGRHGPPDRPLADVVVESVRIEPAGGAPSDARDAPVVPAAPAAASPPVGSGPPVLGIDLESTLERAGHRAPLEPGARLDEEGRAAGSAPAAERGEFVE